MIELVFVACLATAADTCAEHSLLRLPETGLMGCMATAQAQLARCQRAAKFPADGFSDTAFCLIFAPSKGYDEPEILPSSSLSQFCLTAPGAEHSVDRQ